MAERYIISPRNTKLVKEFVTEAALTRKNSKINSEELIQWYEFQKQQMDM
jgi:hypothetical protein